MTDKKANGAGFVEIDGEKYATHSFEFEGTKFTVRELSMDEGDEIFEGTQDDKGKTNNRLNTRMSLAKALIEPKATTDQVGKFGSRKFLTILRHYNELNSLPEVPTPPAGSAGQTSPSGGEPTPTP